MLKIVFCERSRRLGALYYVIGITNLITLVKTTVQFFSLLCRLFLKRLI